MPISEQVASTLGQFASIPEPVTSTTEWLAPLPEPITSTLERVAPNPEQAIPISERAKSNPEWVASIPEQVASTPDLDVSTPERFASTPERVASTPERATPNSERATSNPERVASIPEQVASTPDLDVSTPERFASTPERVASTPERATPNSERATSNPERGAPIPQIAPTHRRCGRQCTARTISGFQLVELLIVLAIVAILAAVAAPSYDYLLAKSEARGTANTLLAALIFARGQAITRGTKTHLCPASAPQAGTTTAGHGVTDVTQLCPAQADYTQGWMVLAWADGEWQIARHYPHRYPRADIRNRAGTERVTSSIRWRSTGIANRNLTFSVCRGNVNIAVVLNRVGRPRIVEGWGDCNAPI
jgi:prepilin-type N-terminal cleavage/methylation domain-containing protein